MAVFDGVRLVKQRGSIFEVKGIPAIGKFRHHLCAACIAAVEEGVLFCDGLYRTQQYADLSGGCEIPAIVEMEETVIRSDKNIFFIIGIDHRSALYRRPLQTREIDHRIGC